MRFSRSTGYGLLALSELAAKGGPISNSTLAKNNGISDRFLLQVMRKLVNAGIVESIKGGRGGYLLAVENPTLLQIVEAIDGPLVATDGEARILKPRPRQKVKQIYNHLVEINRAELDNHRLSEFL